MLNSIEELEALYGQPHDRAVRKQIAFLNEAEAGDGGSGILPLLQCHRSFGFMEPAKARRMRSPADGEPFTSV